MKNGTCPKCGKREIYYKQNSCMDTKNNIWISALSIGVVTYYVCGNCGYLENYLEHDKDLQKITKKWKTVL